MDLIANLEEGQRLLGEGYGGNAGRKQAVLYRNDVWMVKFPQSTRDLQGRHLPSYTSSPLSEYVGSHIYGLLGIPVHETMLGVYKGKVVVACKDFVINSALRLMDFHMLKNTMDEERISGSFASTARGERLSDVVRVLDEAEDLAPVREGLIERFWDMFVVDAFILNGDRNNGNWGILTNRLVYTLAPVFDNGNTFYNKRNVSLMEKRMEDDALIMQDALQGRSFFLNDSDHHIHPMAYFAETENASCKKALLRFEKRIDMKKIDAFIDTIPESAFGLEVISDTQRTFYKKLLKQSFESGIRPAIERVRRETGA